MTTYDRQTGWLFTSDGQSQTIQEDEMFAQTIDFLFGAHQEAAANYAARLLGWFVILVCLIWLLSQLVQGWRLYVWNQLTWARTDLRNRYGQWALVTGATDGIGLELALELARRGHSVILVGRNPNKLADCLKKVEAELRGSSQALTVQLDLADLRPENYLRAFQEVAPERRDLGIVINNAGLAFDNFAPLHKQDLEKLRDLVAVNSVSQLMIGRLVLPSMVARARGLLVNVSSLYGHVPGTFTGAYGPSKSFSVALSRELQLEYSNTGVDVVDLSPGFVNTRMISEQSFRTNAGGVCVGQVEADVYARSALNCLSARPWSACGHPAHGLFKHMLVLGDRLGIIDLFPRLFIQLMASGHDLEAR